MRVLSNATESGRLTFFVIGIVLLNNLSLIYYFNLAVTKLKSILRILLIGQSVYFCGVPELHGTFWVLYHVRILVNCLVLRDFKLIPNRLSSFNPETRRS